MATRKFLHTPMQIADELHIDSNGELWWVKPKVNRKLHKPITTLSKGYIVLRLDQELYFGHIIAWALYYGEWPSAEYDIDHINGMRSDNRKENLRLATRSQNRLNTHKVMSTNTSGFPGVYFMPERNKWLAYITINYHRIFGGQHNTREEAISARLKLERIHNV